MRLPGLFAQLDDETTRLIVDSQEENVNLAFTCKAAFDQLTQDVGVGVVLNSIAEIATIPADVKVRSLTIVLPRSECDAPEQLSGGVLPSGLKHLALYHYKGAIEKGILPEGLEELCLGGYCHDILPGMLPSTLKTLYIPVWNGSSLKDALPDGLTFLRIETLMITCPTKGGISAYLREKKYYQ